VSDPVQTDSDKPPLSLNNMKFHTVPIKDALLNFAATIFFFLPFALFFHIELSTEYYWGTFVILLLAYLYPPVSWKRPNEFSDDPHLKTGRVDTRPA
jgi:hypothetical protein